MEARAKRQPATLQPLVLTCLLLALWGIGGCAGRPAPRGEYPPGYPIGYVERGVASWYGPGFHGNNTANGERFDMHQFTAAHRTLPLGSVATVRSLRNGRHVTVRINDRGPFARSRILDLSLAAAQALEMTGLGTDRVELRVIGYQGRPGSFGYLRIQVASFAEPANAQSLVGRLKRQYPDVRMVAIDLPSGRRYRVQVGQFMSERQAEVVAERLESQFEFEPLVVRDDM
ncbi:MAG TPA: septal ring lytic transglycosylase RlpA family protein [Nitrospiraceae bacterium]|nr:septal ring lytic transglycosylase RlpA family protein [Nitrospiraceae bacterium]